MATQAQVDAIEKVWQAFLQNKGMTDNSPVTDPVSFYADWEVWLFLSSQGQGSLPTAPTSMTRRMADGREVIVGPSRGPGHF